MSSLRRKVGHRIAKYGRADSRPRLLIKAKPSNYYVNFGIFLIEPSKSIFEHVMRAWRTGNHTYFPLFAEQSLMMDRVRCAAPPAPRARRRGVAET